MDSLFSFLLVFFPFLGRALGMSVHGHALLFEGPVVRRHSERDTMKSILWRRASRLNHPLIITIIVGVIGGTAMVAALFLGIFLLARKQKVRRRSRVPSPVSNGTSNQILSPQATTSFSPELKEQSFPASQDSSSRRPTQAEPLQLNYLEPLPVAVHKQSRKRAINAPRTMPQISLQVEPRRREHLESTWFPETGNEGLVRRLEGEITGTSSQPRLNGGQTALKSGSPANVVSSPSERRAGRPSFESERSRPRRKLSQSSFDGTLPQQFYPELPMASGELGEPLRSFPTTPRPRQSSLQGARPKPILPPSPAVTVPRDVDAAGGSSTRDDMIAQPASRFSISPVAPSFPSRLHPPGGSSPPGNNPAPKRHGRLFGSVLNVRTGQGALPDVPTDVR